MKKRVTIAISEEADAMLDAIAARDRRQRGAVIELLIRAAHGATPDVRESPRSSRSL